MQNFLKSPLLLKALVFTDFGHGSFVTGTLVIRQGSGANSEVHGDYRKNGQLWRLRYVKPLSALQP